MFKKSFPQSARPTLREISPHKKYNKGEFTVDLNYHSIESLLKAAKENNCRLSALVLEQQAEQMELPKQEIYEKMRENYRVLASCIQPGSVQF